jgi:SAM-dependent methyltransferase/uncharacterized protein YbaR (Trm112 family)
MECLLPKDLVEILLCPSCGSRLELEVFSSASRDGLLSCRRNHWYPVIKGLPKILVGELRGDYSDFVASHPDWFSTRDIMSIQKLDERGESKQVQETFREKWMTKDTMGVSDSSPYKKFMRKWMLRKYGWKNESGFKKVLNGRRLILDAGAGLGREVINLAKAAKQSIVVGIEFSDCAESALKNVSSLCNAYIIQGDILRPPFKEKSFDFILSEGVLHHTPSTEKAFNKCCELLKSRGEFGFYIYRKRGPIREFSSDYLRSIMQKLPSNQQWVIAEKITRLGKALSQLKAKVRIPEDIPELGIKAGEIDVHKFIYWAFLKCFWNDELPFDENTIVNFDWTVPEHSHRHSAQEIREWCQKNNIEIIWFNEEESGYTVRGLKRQQRSSSFSLPPKTAP